MLEKQDIFVSFEADYWPGNSRYTFVTTLPNGAAVLPLLDLFKIEWTPNRQTKVFFLKNARSGMEEKEIPFVFISSKQIVC